MFNTPPLAASVVASSVCTLAGKRKRPTPAGDGASQPVVDAATRQALRRTILEMLASRSGTMCPSEAPRRLRPSDWRCVKRTGCKQLRDRPDKQCPRY